MNPWILTGLTLEAVMDVIEDGQTIEEVLQSDKWWGSVNYKRHNLITDIFDKNDYWYNADDVFDDVTRALLQKLTGWTEWEYLSDVMMARNSLRIMPYAWECKNFSKEDRKTIAKLIMVANFGRAVEAFPRETIVSYIFDGEKEGLAYTLYEALQTSSIDDMVIYALAHSIKGNDAFLLGCMAYDEEWIELAHKIEIKMPPQLSQYEWYEEYGLDAFIDETKDLVMAPAKYDWEFDPSKPFDYYGIRYSYLACAETLKMNHPELGLLEGFLALDCPYVAWTCYAELGDGEEYVKLMGSRQGPSDDSIKRFKWLIANYDEKEVLKQFRQHWHEARKLPLLDSDKLSIRYNGGEDYFNVRCANNSHIFGTVFYNDGFYYDLAKEF